MVCTYESNINYVITESCSVIHVEHSAHVTKIALFPDCLVARVVNYQFASTKVLAAVAADVLR